MSEWRDIPGHPGYQVNAVGTGRSILRGTPHIIKPQIVRSGHHRISTKWGGIFAHRAVLFAFIGPPAEGQICRHLNGIADDNRVENLTWGTPLENAEDRRRHGYRPPKRIVCDKGHRLTPDNVKVRKDGSRRCLICYTAGRAKSEAKRPPSPSQASGYICATPCAQGGRSIPPPGSRKGGDSLPGICNRRVTAAGEKCWQHQTTELNAARPRAAPQPHGAEPAGGSMTVTPSVRARPARPDDRPVQPHGAEGGRVMAETAENDALYPLAVLFAKSRVGFTRRRFQEVMRVGFVKRDTLLWQLVDNGVIRHASNDRDYFLAAQHSPAHSPTGQKEAE